MAVTWQRGLFRLWTALLILLAILYVVAMAWSLRTELGSCGGDTTCLAQWFIAIALPAIVFLVIGLTIGWLVRWVATGFHRS
jgi:hypothetical protein